MWWFKRKRDAILTLCVLLAILAVSVSAVIYLRNRDSVTLKGEVFMNFLGQKETFDGKTRLSYQDGVMRMKNGSTDVNVMGVPIYFDEGNAMMLTGVMSYTDYSLPALKKVNYFGMIKKDGEICSISIDGKKRSKSVKGGFLFDGADTYVFLEPVELTYGSSSKTLEAMSFVTVKYRQYVTGYSAGEGTVFYEPWEEPGAAVQAVSGQFGLDLSSDLGILPSGQSQMLIPNPEVLTLFQ